MLAMFSKLLRCTLLIALDLYFTYSRDVSNEAWTNVRLINGSTPYEGRVEVKVNDTWGTVCDDRWSPFDGYVVCKQLGFDGVKKVLPGSSYGPGSGPIFHGDLQCTTRESDLSQCPGLHDPNKINCTHKQDAGIKCEPPAVSIHHVTCSSTQFKCSSLKKCVPRRWLCDGYDDCGDNSDEEQLCHEHLNCGTMPVSPISRRIVGGKDAVPGSWPWMTSLRVSFPSGIPDRVLCGGTLINAQWVLTAAHCFDVYKTSSFFHVVLGDYNQKVHENNEQRIGISHVFIHDKYKTGYHDNDIALIKLNHSAILSRAVNYACLPIFDKIDFGPDDTCYIIGWGQTQGTGSSHILQQAQVPIINNNVCNSWYVNDNITDNMICAGYQFGGIDACKGDSGGPLSCKKDGRWYIAGIISWGNGCAQVQQPGIYVNVVKYFDWIVKVIKLYSLTDIGIFGKR